MSQAKSATEPKVKLSKKEMRQREYVQQQRISRLRWGAVGLVVLALLIYGGWQLLRPRPGISVPQLSRTHIQVGDPHEPYNTDPPTSGPHAAPVAAGFYTEAPPDENLVHNLEHGYVVIWYNCTGLESNACDELQRQIQDVMAEAGSASLFGEATKLIAVPRPTMDAQVAATSWGRILKQNALNGEELLAFIKYLRNQAPESGAP